MISLCTISQGSGYIDGYSMDGDVVWVMVVVGSIIYPTLPENVTVTGLNTTDINIIGQNLASTPTGDNLRVSVI